MARSHPVRKRETRRRRALLGGKATKVRAGRVAPLPQSRAPRRLQTARSRSRASHPIDRNPFDPSGMRPKARGLSGARARPLGPIPSTHPRFAKTRARREYKIARVFSFRNSQFSLWRRARKRIRRRKPNPNRNEPVRPSGRKLTQKSTV